MRHAVRQQTTAALLPVNCSGSSIINDSELIVGSATQGDVNVSSMRPAELNRSDVKSSFMMKRSSKMSVEGLPFPACMLAGKNSISSSDVMLLRKYSLPDGVTSWADAHMLITISRNCEVPCPEWESYFVESLALFVVHHLQPAGTLSESKSRWLQRLLAPSGTIQSALEMEVLLHSIEIAAETPVSLSAFALDQIRKCLMARLLDIADQDLEVRGISQHDMEAIWRVLRAAVDRGHVMLMPLERMVLMAIDAIAPPEAHDPAWNEFVARLRDQDDCLDISA
ncbi:hypothetical protein [Rhizobium oryzicola]|uniref:Uncharacterized protein n=1 Tax=Rhizobium oryzicola TaxID=1232668 RepID=A0ABT8SZG1_9HYPH|nr:hypothetical protein [Rhizobium oryzicola]MDO1583751.1 hypothetical protein [Rhizobium oryzicola]